MTCSKCNSPAEFKQGIKKETGKPWSGYFCQNQNCKNVDWTPKKPAPQPETKPQPNGFQVLSDQMNDLRNMIYVMMTPQQRSEYEQGKDNRQF